MKARVDLNDFMSAVARTKRSVPKKSLIPMMENLMVKAEGDKVELIAVDSSSEMHIKVDAQDIEPGAFCINPEILENMMRFKSEYRNQQLSMDCNPDDGTVIFRWNKKTISTKIVKGALDPWLYSGEEYIPLWTTTYEDFKNIFNTLSLYNKDAEGNPLTSFCLNMEEGYVTACDRGRVAVKMIRKGLNPISKIKEVKLPKDFLPKIRVCWPVSEMDKTFVELAKYGDNHLMIKGTDFYMILEDNEISSFYNVLDIVKESESMHSCTFNQKNLMEIAKYNSTLYKDRLGNSMVFYNAENGMYSHIRYTDTDYVDKLDVMENDLPMDFMICFNPNYIFDLCLSVKERVFTAKFTNSNGGILVCEGDWKFFILPIKCTDAKETKKSINRVIIGGN